MSKKLVIVESAGKIKKISEYLGSDYIVKASLGHCMDLDPNNLSIDVENNYKPNYIICEGKHKLVNELIKVAAECNSVILATDNDREGEAIAYFLSNMLKLSNPPRIIFTEITKKAINSAIENPITINMNMVHAQQTRRLLDRLLGYKISPIIQKNLKDKNAKSAGRVQSVVVKIINDKENEINNALTTSYLKTTCELEFEKNKLKCVLMKGNDIYKLDFDPNILLQQMNKKTVFKVVNIQNKLSIRKPSPPFITSTLQQEASTKLRFNIKKTMDVAQKLYEGGHITYMRTDSPNLSVDAINSCQKYIIDKFGLIYSNPTNYKSSGNAQEAHEAIRPTNLNIPLLESDDKDQVKLYHLIWKKTVASQMSPAKINIQNIFIDTLNDNTSIFINELLNSIWLSTYSNILFDGFLILDNDKDEDEENEEEQSGSIPIEINNVLKFNKLFITEEYTKLPLRFNEANLVKYLEKNNIGRPSTYATIINKIIERNYVEIKDIEGITKQIKIIELNKKLNINETLKDIVIGKENKKIVPTNLGIKITEFLQTNFDDIMQIDFTADFETYLDKISEGKATWYNVLDKFYKKFNTIVVELNKTETFKSSDKSIGFDEDNREIFVGSGKYGPYIKIIEDDKPKYFSVDTEDIDLEKAIERIRFPKTLGKINKKVVTLNKGQYGYYIKFDNQNYSATETTNLEDVVEIIKQKRESQKVFTIRSKKIYVNNGKFGPYLHIVDGKGEIKNIPLPKNTDLKNIEYKNILEIISKKNI